MIIVIDSQTANHMAAVESMDMQVWWKWLAEVWSQVQARLNIASGH